MQPIRKLNRRSFLATVGAASGLALSACVTPPIEERPYDPPAEPRNVPNNDYGRAPPCVDGDYGRHHDRPGHGRICRGRPPRRH